MILRLSLMFCVLLAYAVSIYETTVGVLITKPGDFGRCGRVVEYAISVLFRISARSNRHRPSIGGRSKFSSFYRRL